MTQRRYSKESIYTDCCERLYPSVLILRSIEPNMLILDVQQVNMLDALQVMTHSQAYRMSGTDLYNFAYFVNGDEDALDKLKDPSAAKLQRKRTTLPVMQLNGWLKSIASNTQYTQIPHS